MSRLHNNSDAAHHLPGEIQVDSFTISSLGDILVDGPAALRRQRFRV